MLLPVSSCRVPGDMEPSGCSWATCLRASACVHRDVLISSIVDPYDTTKTHRTHGSLQQQSAATLLSARAGLCSRCVLSNPQLWAAPEGEMTRVCYIGAR